ncbi:MAG: TetR family transcriptional regulator C-terminal domain-containing protein [Ilumatobacteraceae bacterium]
MNGSGSALGRLDAVLCESLPTDADDASWLLWIETWGETRRSDALRSVMGELDAHENAAVAHLIGLGVAAGEFTCPDPTAAASRLTAVRDGLAIDRRLFHRDLPVRRCRHPTPQLDRARTGARTRHIQFGGARSHRERVANASRLVVRLDISTARRIIVTTPQRRGRRFSKG